MTTDKPITLTELAERCEAATGHDQALDMVIASLCHEHGEGLSHWSYDQWAEQIEVNPFTTWVPAYTASVDAALTLVPEGWWIQFLGQCLLDNGHSGWRARIETQADQVEAPQNSLGLFYAKTAALAICDAALRARAA